tara:strand:+ start:711 stop:1100 length:390 start_codon:yes stop_codon:yes gene_type:complete
MNNLTHKVNDNGDVVFDFAPVKITISEVQGDDIAENGGVKFSMNFIKDDGEAKKVDEFVIYPEAIDWENGGQMKPEYQEKIKQKMEAQEAHIKNEIEAINEHEAKLTDQATDADEAMSVSEGEDEVHSN